MLGAATAGGGGDGAGGPAMAERGRDEEVEGPTHGGEDDPVDDGAITMEDLTRSWNPRLKREKDRPAFTEAMPADDLPPDDAEWLDRVRAAPAPELQPSTTVDGLLQPSPEAAAAGLTSWIRHIGHWVGEDPARRALTRALAPSAPCLQDPWGRVLLARARAGAAASWLLLDTPTLRDPVVRPPGGVPGARGPGIHETAVVQLCLEVAGSGRRVDEVQAWAQEHGGALPAAHAVLAAHLPDAGRPERWRRLEPRPLDPHAGEQVIAALSDLADLPSARAFLPSLVEVAPSEEPDDDPLGLDALIAEHTGGRPDPQAGLYHSGIQAAERMAAAVARARVRLAGSAAALGDACRHWSAGTPTANLLDAMTHLDQQVTRALQLLVEIARAAQRRAVPPRGIRNGLTHAAKAIDDAVAQCLQRLAAIAGGVLPGSSEVPVPGPRDPDPLDDAFAEGSPHLALAWLDAQPPSASVVAARVLVRMADGEPAADLVDPLRDAISEAREERREALALALETCLGPCLLWAGAPDAALELADAHLKIGRARRNGLVVANAAMLGVEAHRMNGDAAAADALRLEGGRLCWHMGARGALTLLARWSPPDEEG